MWKINGEDIDAMLIEEAFQRIKSAHELLSEDSCCQRDAEFYSEAEQEVIRGILLAQEAEKRYPTISDDVFQSSYKKTISEWRQHGASWELIEAQALQLREETAAGLRMKWFIDDICKDLTTPSDEECYDYYSNHLHQYYEAPRVRAWHLLRNPDPRYPWIDHQEMVRFRELATEGCDFMQLAREHTTKPDHSIDLGWTDMERATNAFESILFSLRVGEISPVIYYENAFHLVMVSEIKSGQTISFTEALEEIRNQISVNQRREAMRHLADHLKCTATLEKSYDS